MDLFLLKKIISAFIMPLSLVILLLICSLILFKRKPKLSYKLLISATTMLFFSAFPPFSDQLMGSIEEEYPPFSHTVNKIDYIVVLGCYHSADNEIPATLQLKACSLQRLVEALRIHRLYPQATIITSGGAFGQSSANAYVIKQAAVSLGIPEDKIITENFPKDTAEEAEIIAPRVQNTTVVLVTNAYHMPRAINYFKQQGVNAIAAPASYWVPLNQKATGWDYYMPKSDALMQTTLAWHEILGTIQQKLKQLFS
jgi:uncharacterized SAM-binding protein YcdF (DUF218 family)